jgi:hypothetical protein
VANGRAEELTLIVGHLQEPARPAPRIAADLAIGQVAYNCQRLLAGGRPVRQFNPFLVRQDAVSEVEMEEIKRHLTLTRGGLVCSILDSGTDKVPNSKLQLSLYKSFPWVSVAAGSALMGSVRGALRHVEPIEGRALALRDPMN